MSPIGIQPNIQPNTNPADKRDTEKSGASDRKFDSSQSQGKASASADTGQSQQLMAAFQLFLPMLTKLIQQFSSGENPPQQENPDAPIAEPTPDEPGKPTLPGQSGRDDTVVGTPGDDKLVGTYSEDRISGLAGNDRLFGRQGNDVLSGNSGNDDLYGGRGDDTLYGGTGNDYLSGGTGNNQLFGGEGDDILASRLGSDKLDGGQGNDTARIRGSIDNYSVQVNLRHRSDDIPEGYQPTDLDKSPRDTQSIILTHNETGQTIEVSNIEQFRFDDARLSLAEMKQRAEPIDTPPPPPTEPDPLLELSASQKENLFSLFGEDSDTDAAIRVVDKDGNGKISVGDEAVLSRGDASSVSQQFRTLSAEDVAKINGEPVETPADARLELPNGALSREQQDHFSSIVYRRIETGTNLAAGLFIGDGNNNGKLSLLSISDNDNNGKLSVGDVLKGAVIDGQIGQVVTHTLTQSDIDSYLNTAAPKELELSQRQHDAISHHFDDLSPLAYDGLATEYTGKTLDKDGDNKLSEGDIVKLRHFGGNSPFPSESVEDHALTATDIASINDFSSEELVPLSSKERSQLQQAVLRQDVAYIPGDGPHLASVVDNDSNGKLSVGDTINIVNTNGFESGNPTFTTRSETLTQAQLDRYEAGISYNPSDTIDLDDNQTKALLERFNLAEGQSFYKVLDSNGDDKLSIGDQLEYLPGDDHMQSSYDPLSHILTAEDVAAINGDNNNEPGRVTLTAAQKSATEAVTGLSDIHVDDADKSGTLSEGDVVVSSVPGSQKKELSADDVKAILAFQPPSVQITEAQKSAIETVTGLTDIRVDDHDLSGTLSAGDVVVSSVPGSEPKELSASDVEAILSFQPPSVSLTATQKTAIETLTGLKDIRVDDNDLSGTLSEGDEVVSSEPGNAKVKLSAEDIAKINAVSDTNIHDIKLEDDKITIDGKSFSPKIPVGEVALGTLLIGFDNDSQRDEIRHLLESFSSHDVEITREFSSLTMFFIKVPEQYTGHWAAALEEVLPSHPSVAFNGINYAN